MPATKYTYSISTDFINQIVATDRLSIEISDSAIVTALDYINTSGDDCDIWFKDTLSGGDETILDGLVAVHTGEALPNDGLSVVLVHPKEKLTHGYTTSSGSVLTVMRATAYTQQTSDAQRSLVSSSASDNLAGAGARTIQITYYDQDMNGPYIEIVDMDGTNPVNTVNSNICYIEKFEVETVGNQLSNVGTITLKAAIAGGGATIGTIAAGDGTTYWAHHYVSADKTMYLVSFMGTTKGMNTGALEIRKTNPIDVNKPECSVTPKLRIPPGTSNCFNFSVPITITGPAQVTMYGRSDASSGLLDWSVAMDYYEE
jgi:hypothetical protein